MNKKTCLVTSLLLMLGIACLAVILIIAGTAWWVSGGSFFTNLTSRTLYQGIAYKHIIRTTPRQISIHVATVDLRKDGISFLVTPGDPNAERPLKARTTSQFLAEFELQLAINGDGFTPWHSNGPLDYYPHVGDPVTPNGLAASRGKVYTQARGRAPVLYISRNNQVQFNTPPEQIYNAISGNVMLVENGKPSPELRGSPGTPEPRTAVGIDKRGQKLYLVVVDGRQPGYSEGVTLTELANILIEFGVYTAMNLDGGGSSTLVVQGKNGQPEVLNSPIDVGIPRRERAVANHLGVYAKPR